MKVRGLSCMAPAVDTEEPSADAAGADSQFCRDVAGVDALASAPLSEMVGVAAVAVGTAFSAVVTAASAFWAGAHEKPSFAFLISV